MVSPNSEKAELCGRMGEALPLLWRVKGAKGKNEGLGFSRRALVGWLDLGFPQLGV